jgi:uncharacterized protein
MWRTTIFAIAATALLFGETAAARPPAGMPAEGRVMVAQSGSQHATEPALRAIIAQLRAGNPDYATLEPQLAQAIRPQAAASRALLERLGSLERIEFIGTQNGADLYRGTFANGATIWAIKLSPAGKVAALFFRPDVASAPAADPSGIEVTTSGLSGTLRKPDGVERPPVVLLIAGSGPTDRNGNQAGQGPDALRQIAEALVARGIASLRYDKRGVGRSAVPANFREEDFVLGNFVDDAAAWLAFLAQRSDLGPRFVAGHSEGGLIAILLAKRAPVSGIMLLATPGRPVGEATREQLRAADLPKPILDEALATLAALERGESVAQVSPPLMPLLRPSVQPFLRSMLAVAPAQELKGLHVPVLVAQGGRDRQVSAADAAALIDARPDAQVFRAPEMNHVLKRAPDDAAGQQKSYTDPSIPLAPGLAEALAAFVRENGG